MKTHIRFSILIVAAVMAASGRARDFGILFISVTLHELAHVLVAKLYGGRVESVSFSIMGEIAVIRGLTHIRAARRMLIYLAGPAANALIAPLMALFAVVFPASREIFNQISVYNLALCLFNLLPVFPLDGGRLAQIIAGNRAGALRANRFIILAGGVIAVTLMIIGAVQVILFPYNISLICAGVYILRVNKKSKAALTYEFFRVMFERGARLEAAGILPVKLLAAGADCPLGEIVRRFGWDNLTCVMPGGETERMLTETQLARYIMEYGLCGTVGEAAGKIKI